MKKVAALFMVLIMLIGCLPVKMNIQPEVGDMSIIETTEVASSEVPTETQVQPKGPAEKKSIFYDSGKIFCAVILIGLLLVRDYKALNGL